MTFALITEGVSEHRIVRHIISKYFKHLDPEINQIQPIIINDKQKSDGGWNEVLKYCAREEIKSILIENDYLIIQIDTDLSQTSPFSVSHTNADNSTKTVEQLTDDIIDKLKSLIDKTFLDANSEKIFFAVCVHTIECWLLPIYARHDSKKRGTTSCFSSLNTELRRHDIHVIPDDKNNANGIKAYEEILKNFKRKKDIDAAASYNDGFKKFIDSISTIDVPDKA